MDKQKVLIADDEAPIREILKIYCEKEGFDVIEAADGAEAILKVQSEKPDIIILDIMMPVLDGLEVCKQVRKMSDIPIIMLTAKDDDDDRILGLEIGADDYITKPFNNREVIARVKAVLRRSSAVKKDEAGGRSHIEYRGLSIDMENTRLLLSVKNDLYRERNGTLVVPGIQSRQGFFAQPASGNNLGLFLLRRYTYG